MTLDEHDTRTCSEECAAEMMRTVAGKLREREIKVRVPDHHEGRRLVIENATRARSNITVQDSDYVSWDYWPWSGGATDPVEIARMALEVLGNHAPGPIPSANRSLMLKGAAGQVLRAHGLRVSLAVHEDDEILEALADIEVVNPDMPSCGLVRITDDGIITWEYQHDGTPDQCALAVADTIVPILIHGIGKGAPQKRPTRERPVHTG